MTEERPYSDDISPVAMSKLHKTVRDVARILRHADPKMMGILESRGFSKIESKNRFDLHFRQPEGWERPQSLRSLLKKSSKGPRHSLNQRIELARMLASAVFYIHSCDFVHKNIRPDNVIVFDPVSENIDPSLAKYHQFPRSLGKPFLIGYDGVRKAEAASLRIRTDEWQKSVYLSPERQRLNVGDEFTMAHDVYSLGVLLLEVALWEDFTTPICAKRLFWQKGTQQLKAPEELRASLVMSAETDIPRLLGTKYADAVVACLIGLKEDDSPGFLTDKDGVIKGTAYIIQVMKRLETISL